MARLSHDQLLTQIWFEIWDISIPDEVEALWCKAHELDVKIAQVEDSVADEADIRYGTWKWRNNKPRRAATGKRMDEATEKYRHMRAKIYGRIEELKAYHKSVYGKALR